MTKLGVLLTASLLGLAACGGSGGGSGSTSGGSGHASGSSGSTGLISSTGGFGASSTSTGSSGSSSSSGTAGSTGSTGSGSSSGCRAASDCGVDSACRTFSCNAGVCSSVDAHAGTVVANPVVGDCRSDQCDGHGAVMSDAEDDTDVPADDGSQCTLEACSAGQPVHPAAPSGTACNQSGGVTCDGAGNCVPCLLDSDCPTNGPCEVARCSSGSCLIEPAPAQTLSASLQVAGDCQSLTCDGASTSPVSVADDGDLPADDGNACTGEVCSSGTPTHPALASGVACSQGGGSYCDGSGACVQCVSASQCAAGANPCQVATCSAGRCGFGPAPSAALSAAMQTAGDCQQLQCDGSSQAPVSVADDSDVPADDGNPCTRDTCSNGAPVHPASAIGSSCSANGGTECDGQGNCVPAPAVVGTTPADGDSAHPRTTLSIAFSAAMNAASLTGQTSAGACSGTVQLSLNDFASCIALSSASAVMSSGDTIATFSARPGLLVNRTYKIRVTTGATSALGLALAAQYTSSLGFTTTTAGHLDGSLVISQVYGGGGGSSGTPSYKSDYVVLHNRGTTPVSLAGLSLQYASASGTSWSTPAVLSGTIAPGGYFLVALNTGTAGASLPAPDLTMTAGAALALSASAGKIALVSTTTQLASGACPDPTKVVDFVAYGTTTCAEGTSTAALSTTTAAIRKAAGCTDTDVNASDLSAGAPNPLNSSSPAVLCDFAQNESGAALEADFCDTLFPLVLSATSGTASGPVYGQVCEAGLTEPAGASASVLAQLGYGPLSANPEYESGWSWQTAAFNVQSGNNDEYQLSFTAPAPGTYGYAYRFSLDDGASWTYCDNAQADNGAGSNTGLTFDLENLGVLTVTP